MNRTLWLMAVLAVSGCGSRVEFFPTALSATRESDDKVLVKANMGIRTLGIDSTDLAKITELCMTATWTERAAADAGSSDAGTSDAGTSDAGVSPSDGGVITLPATMVGAKISSATQCKPGTGGSFELRSADPIPSNQEVIVTVTPSESDASRTARSSGGPPATFDSAQFLSP